MPKLLHPSPYTGLESCEVCWADQQETDITIYKNIPYCETHYWEAKERDND